MTKPLRKYEKLEQKFKRDIWREKTSYIYLNTFGVLISPKTDRNLEGPLSQ